MDGARVRSQETRQSCTAEAIGGTPCSKTTRSPTSARASGTSQRGSSGIYSTAVTDRSWLSGQEEGKTPSESSHTTRLLSLICPVAGKRAPAGTTGRRRERFPSRRSRVRAPVVRFGCGRCRAPTQPSGSLRSLSTAYRRSERPVRSFSRTLTAPLDRGRLRLWLSGHPRSSVRPPDPWSTGRRCGQRDADSSRLDCPSPPREFFPRPPLPSRCRRDARSPARR